MGTYRSTRRQFIKTIGAGAAALALRRESIGLPAVYSVETNPLLVVNPEPRFDLSPYLYMQFMEPLGTTDGSVAAAWDFKNDRWRQDVVAVTKELSPALIRWGGCFSSYYRWKEAVGPRDRRIPMVNLLWGGIESNQVGTHEFVDFCRQVGADPFMSVNFESDGMKIVSGRIFELAANPEFEVIQTQSDEIVPKEKNLPASCRWIFPPASVSAVELDVQ